MSWVNVCHKGKFTENSQAGLLFAAASLQCRNCFLETYIAKKVAKMAMELLRAFNVFSVQLCLTQNVWGMG